MSEASYQLLPELTADEYQALKADVAERGVLVPVVVDQHGDTLDGHHRLRAVAELRAEGVHVADPATVRVECATPADAREHAVKLNLLRRQVGPVTWARLFRDYAADRGVEVGQGKRNDRTSANVAEVAREVGVSARTARRRLKLADRVADDDELAAKVDSGEMEARRAERILRDRDAEQRREQQRAEVAERARQAEAEGAVEVGRYDHWTSPRRLLLLQAERHERSPYGPESLQSRGGKRIRHYDVGIRSDLLTAGGSAAAAEVPEAVAEAEACYAELRQTVEEREAALQRYIHEQCQRVAELLRQAAEAASDEPTILIGRRTVIGDATTFTQTDARNLGATGWLTPHEPDGCACGDATPAGCIDKGKDTP